MIFAPIFMPFGLFLYLMIAVELYGENFSDVPIFGSIIRNKWVFYSMAFILSPIIEIVGLFIGGFVMGYIVASELCCKREFSFNKCLFSFILGIFLGALIIALTTAAALVLAVFIPVAGTFFLFSKLIFMIQRNFKTGVRVQAYPRSIAMI